ncbi:dnaJ homolog subfamily C member 12-like [Anneissia japonica]|uniref:dnaJ homolog subfamily C member 12-like n=1 Tax=Anneissia japonica TaxID=1529436 RepID=UPI0014256AC9|nr:dnaJ homolog subfamily C member 12-like [Anneissia japonica]
MDAILQYDPRKEETFYQVLGCNPLSTVEQINTEYKIKALKYHPDKNPDDMIAAQEFSKIQRARDILVNEEKRKEYDMWLSSGLHIPYEEWSRLKDSVKTSMHWSMKVKTDPMIEDTTKDVEEDDAKYGNNQASSFAEWKRQPQSDIINKFRNYDI